MFVFDDLLLAAAAEGGAEALGAEALGAGEAAAGLGAAEAGALAYPGIPPAAAMGPTSGLELAQLGSAPVSDAVATGAAPNAAGEAVSRGLSPQAIDYPSGTTYSQTPAIESAPSNWDKSNLLPPRPDIGSINAENLTAPQESSFLDKATAWAKKNPALALTGGILAANALGGRGARGPAGYTPGILDKYRLSPNFQGRYANPLDYQYTPRYAEGGIASYNEPNPMRNPYDTGNAATYPQAAIPQSEYTTGLQEPRSRTTTPQTFFTDAQGMASGGSTSALLSMYEQMMRRAPSKAPSSDVSVGIVEDNDPDTRNLDAYRAAQIRLAKIGKRANVTSPAQPKVAGLGSLSLGPAGAKKDDGPQYQEAAQGGIMGASTLGGYAAGGNPRLLKGPGDGMSDDIPATINNRQPARLADGEFVIPADVVSHLGNGSTDAGAKKLHNMMDTVRKARTGNSKQGKQINPDKFLPR